MVSHLTGRGVYRRRGKVIRAIMDGCGMLVAVRSDRGLPFSENLFAWSCILLHGEMKQHRVTQRSVPRLVS